MHASINFDIENRNISTTLDAADPVEEGSLQWAVVDTFVYLTALVVLVDYVAHRQFAQDPVRSQQISLEYRATE